MPRSFRLSERSIANLKDFANLEGLNLNASINKILEDLDLEQKKEEEQNKGDFFTLPIWLSCPRDNKWYLRENLLDPDNDAGCHSAKTNCKKRCPAWKFKELFIKTLPERRNKGGM